MRENGTRYFKSFDRETCTFNREIIYFFPLFLFLSVKHVVSCLKGSMKRGKTGGKVKRKGRRGRQKKKII